MPDMDGLSMIREANLLQPKLKSMVFSAYDDFQYAKTAIDIGVSKYILKPIKVDEFIDSIMRLLDELNELHAEQNSQTFYEALFGVQDGAVELPVSSGYLLLLDFVMPFFNRRSAEDSLPKLPKEFYQVPLNEHQCLLIAPDHDSGRNYISVLCNHFHDSENIFLIICGGIFNSPSEMRECFERSEAYSSMKFYLKSNEVAYLDDEPTPPDQKKMRNLWDTCTQIGKLANRQETESAENLLLDMFSMLQKERSFPIVAVKSACGEIVRECCFFDDYDPNNITAFLLKIDQCGCIEDLNNIMSEVIHQNTFNNSVAASVQKAIHLIHDNYAQDICLESVAAQVFLSPCYFSYLFKKTTGVNFLKYLTSYRVERAKELLQTTQMRVGEICEKVGYSNRSYFCQIFRNQCGMSPIQYRETAK